MTAQQQLAELNAIDGSWSDATEAKAAGWVDRNGGDVARLLQTGQALEAKLPARNPDYFANAELTAFRAALRKLTRDA